jgi:hypothetical protein
MGLGHLKGQLMFLPWTWCPDMSQALHIGKKGHGSESMLPNLFPIDGNLNVLLHQCLVKILIQNPKFYVC